MYDESKDLQKQLNHIFQLIIYMDLLQEFLIHTVLGWHLMMEGL